MMLIVMMVMLIVMMVTINHDHYDDLPGADSHVDDGDDDGLPGVDDDDDDDHDHDYFV